ncbi:protein scribble homolog, partial [Anopheles bellator]|uniref:protein scribble homolog n=1 Tax=Anopheles bellator TaxID=139047 RepID=UPI0026495053
MENQQKPTPKSDKVFSFLSQDEVEKLRQEEERKIATLGRDNIQRRYEAEDEGQSDGEQQQHEQSGYDVPEPEKSDINDNSVRNDSPRYSAKEESPMAAQQKLSPAQLASLLSKTPVVSRIPIRTANAEKRARANNCLPPEYDESKLSPSEIRALRAQKRAAWRQARLKSLENDALQAQIMIQTMNAVVLSEDTPTNDASAGDATVEGQPGEAASSSLNFQPLHVLNEETAASWQDSTTPTRQSVYCGDAGDHQNSLQDDTTISDGAVLRFPRLAVKSRPGSEVVVRETEKVVEEKVTHRTEEAPGGGLWTVEYIEKVIETE